LQHVKLTQALIDSKITVFAHSDCDIEPVSVCVGMTCCTNGQELPEDGADIS
jgi:hypothetical protein